MDEILALQKELAAVQEQDTVHRLSERWVREGCACGGELSRVVLDVLMIDDGGDVAHNGAGPSCIFNG
jgi:hypothetical protein